MTDNPPGAMFRPIVPHQHSRVTYAELFFDLVFVFAVTQISHTLLAHFTPLGVLQVTLLFLAVWWVWVFTSWITNWLNPEKTPVRLLLFAMMLGGLVSLSDRRLVRVIRRCQDLPGQRLFAYRDDDGDERPIESSDVNDYIRAATGDDFTAKDFRTWAATVLAAQELRRTDDVPAAVKAVAEQLGNTPAVCRRSYINPVVLTPVAGRGHPHAAPVLTRPSGLNGDERRVLALLRRATPRRASPAPRGA